MVVYIDVLLAVNFLITYFLLITSAVLTGYTYSRKRILISSVAGAFFCLYIFVQSENVFAEFCIKSTSLLVCALIAYGKANIKKLVLQTVCFIIMNVMLTGFTVSASVQSNMIYHNNMFLYININPVILVGTSLIIYITAVVFSSIKEKIYPEKTFKTDILFDSFSILGVNAFYDSGFKVKDIISNKDVMIVSFEKVYEMIPLNLYKELENFFNENYKEIKTVFIPVFFNTISGEGMIPALKAEKIVVNGIEVENILIGFVKNRFSENVSAIFGSAIKKQL